MEKLYFIAIIPAKPSAGIFAKIKNVFEENYNSKAAKRSPPHITIHMPFKFKESKEHLIVSCLKEAVHHIEKFEVTCNGFGRFENKLIYVNIPTNSGLIDLHKKVSRNARRELNQIPRSDSRPFHPHITVAFRDLKKKEFTEAWQEFEDKPLKLSFWVNSIWILKHDGKLWEPSIEIPFTM